jgi:cytidyltransferase-like protein
MRTVYTKMVADLFHPGHVEFLKAARALGDRLVVHVVDDHRVQAAKRLPVMTQQERAAVVAACRHVDEVRLDGPKVMSQTFMRQEGFDLYAVSFSDDNEMRAKRGDCGDLPDTMIAVLAYTSGISTTMLLQRIAQRQPFTDH